MDEWHEQRDEEKDDRGRLFLGASGIPVLPENDVNIGIVLLLLDYDSCLLTMGPIHTESSLPFSRITSYYRSS